MLKIYGQLAIMPSCCSVFQCHSRSDRDGDKIKFFRLPLVSKKQIKIEITTKRQNSGIAALKRTDLATTSHKNIVVCSRHFLSGKNLILFLNNIGKMESKDMPMKSKRNSIKIIHNIHFVLF